MANVDRATLKSRQQNLTDRTGEFSSDPLIQKEDQQSVYGDDFMDSALVKLPNIGSINGPGAAFNVDFDFSQGVDRYDIDTTGSVDSVFTITLAGLNDNETGILNITKKSQDIFSFANGLITPFNNTESQNGQTSLVMFVKVVNSTYIVQIGYNYIVPTANIKDLAVTNAKIDDLTIEQGKAANSAFPKLDASFSSGCKVKTINIGSWNMNSTASVDIAHGVTDLYDTKPIIYVTVISDSEIGYNLEKSGFVEIFGAIIRLNRYGSGFFDSSNFDGGGNRGSITILYQG